MCDFLTLNRVARTTQDIFSKTSIQQTEICNWQSADQQLDSTQQASAIGRNNALAFYCGQHDFYTLDQPQPQHSAATPQLHPNLKIVFLLSMGFNKAHILFTK